MKNILIVALIILVASKAHNHKEDKFEECMNEFCRDEADACVRAYDCISTLKFCGNELKQNKNVVEYSTCLDQSPEAYNIMVCVINNCSDAKSHFEAVKMLINHMN